MRHHSRGSATSRRIARLAALFSLGRVLHRARGKAVSTDRRKTRGIDSARLPRQVWKQIATCPHSSTIIFKRGKLFRLKKKPLPTPLRAVAAPALIAQPPQIAKVAGPLPVKPPPFNAAPSTTTAPLAQSKASSSASGVARTTSTAQTSEFTATASKPKVSRYSNGRKKKVIAADSEDEDDFIQPPILTLRPAGALEQLAPRDDPPEKAYYFNRWKSSHATADDVDNFSHLLAVSKDNLIDALLHCDLKKQITRKDLLALERGVALRAGSGRQFGGRWSWYEGMNAENQALVFLRDIMDDKVAFLVLPGVTNIVDLTTLGVIAQRVKKLIVYVDVKGNDYTYVSILPSELAAACTKLGNVTKNLFDEKKSTKPSPSESLRLLADALETIEKFNVGSEVERLTVLMVSGYLARLVMIVGITINRAIGHQRWFDSAGLDRTIVPRFVEVEDNDEDEDFEHQRIEAADNSAKDSKYSSSSPSIPQSIVLLARSIRKSIPGEALEWKSCGNASCPLILYPSSFVEATVVWTGPDGVDRCNTCRRHFAKYVREWPMKTGTIKVNVGAYLLDADGNSDVTECEAPKCPYKRSGVFRHWGDGRYRCEGCSNFKTINYGNDWPIKSISIEIDEKGVEVEVIDEINVRYSSHRARYKDEILVEYGVPTGGCLNDGLFGCPFAQGPDRARPKFGRCSSCYNHHKKHGAMDWPETPDGTILNRIALKRNMRKGIPVYDADILRIMTEYLDTSE